MTQVYADLRALYEQALLDLKHKQIELDNMTEGMISWRAQYKALELAIVDAGCKDQIDHYNTKHKL